MIEFVKNFETMPNKPIKFIPPIVPLKTESKRARFKDMIKKEGKRKIAPNKFAKKNYIICYFFILKHAKIKFPINTRI